MFKQLEFLLRYCVTTVITEGDGNCKPQKKKKKKERKFKNFLVVSG
jgi:hypothetical protein